MPDLINKLSEYFRLQDFEKIAPLKRSADKLGISVANLILSATGILLFLVMFSFGSNIIASLVGFVYPAYMTFKCLEQNPIDPLELREWLTYWVIYSFLVCIDSLLTLSFFWLGTFFQVGKIVGYIALFHPKVRGAAYIYNTFVRDILKRYEGEIDSHIQAVSNKIASGGKPIVVPPGSVPTILPSSPDKKIN